MTRKSTRRSAATAGEPPVGPIPKGATLLDVLRALDLDTLDNMLFRGYRKQYLGARLACKALRDAFDTTQRMVSVTATDNIAREWQAGQRSYLARAFHCSHLVVKVASFPEIEEEEEGEGEEDSEDGCGQRAAGAAYPHDHLARLALLGTTAEGRASVKNLRLTCNGSGLELSSVVSALLSQLPGLEALDAADCVSPAGMGIGDRTRPAVMHHALASYAPRLDRLNLPSTSGMLHGLGALAACSGLTHLSISGRCTFGGTSGDPAELDAQAVAGLSQLMHLRNLRLLCHDPSGGTHLAALLGGRRPPSLQSLGLTCSVHVIAAAASARGSGRSAGGGGGRTQNLPAVSIGFEAGPGGPGRIVNVVTDPPGSHVPGPSGLDLLCQVLVAATDQLPPHCRRLQMLYLQCFDMSCWAASEEHLHQSLGPEGPVPVLLERCDRVELGLLELREARAQAACAVLRVLGMPARLRLRHGCLDLEASAKPQPQPSQAGEPRSLSSLRLETATPDAVLREAVERLWRAAAEPATDQHTDGECFTYSDIDSVDWRCYHASSSKFVLLRGVPQLPAVADSGGGDVHKALGRWLDGLAGLAPPADAQAPAAGAGAEAGASAEDAGLGLHLGRPGVHVSALCANTFVCTCRSGDDAEELVAALAPAGAEAPTSWSCVGRSGGSEVGGMQGAEPRRPAPAVPVAAQIAAHVPRRIPGARAYNSTSLVKRAVLQVLSEMWHRPPADDARGRRRSSAGGAKAAAAVGGPSAGQLGGAAVGRIRQVLDLDLALTRQWRAVHTLSKALNLPDVDVETSDNDASE